MLALAFLITIFPSVSSAQENQQSETAEQKIIRSLNWIRGPQSVNLFNNSTLNVPNGYVFLNQQDAKKFMEVLQNPSSGHEYLIARQDLGWFGIFEFSETGLIKDDDKIDASAVLESIRRGTEEGNKERRSKGWQTMSVIGWKLPPYYDAESKRLEWAIEGRDSGGSTAVNLNTRILGRKGVTSVVLVTTPTTFDADVREFKNALRGFTYVAGEQYHEFKQGDKIAEYGLAALIVGGAAAVATKKGFWAIIAGFFAAFWKILAGGAIALLAWIVSLIKRKKS
jgi:uncharacterized membrane-anchored protein